MKTKFFTAISLFMAISIFSTQAQVRKTAVQQHMRIHQGVKSGELTKAEAMNLRNGQREIHQDIKEAKADGKITRNERKEIRQDQRVENRKIFRKKHNNMDRD